MRRWLALHGILIGLLAGVGCAKPKVWVPPRIDLQRHGTLGLVEFRSADEHGAAATRRFLATLHAAQPGTPVLELPPLAELLRSVERSALDPEAARAIRERYGVDALVLGDLDIDAPRPTFSVQSFSQATARAEIQGTLAARIVDTRSGATLWSDEARGKRSVAHLDLSSGSRPDFGAADPDGEHARLVGWLVDSVTDDFRGRWARP